jgi:FkbM family methyltransferase
MRYNFSSRVDAFTNFINDILPDNRLKNFLRKMYRGHYNRLYSLNKFITDIKLLDVNTISVKLNDGAIFYGPRDSIVLPTMKYGNPKKLDKLWEYQFFGSFFMALHDQYMMGINEKYYKLKKGDVVVDVGAHIGTFTIRASKMVGDAGKVIAIEPEPQNIALLKRNVEANALQNVVIVPEGIWSSKGKQKFYLSPETWGHSYLSQIAKSTEYNEIEMDTLDCVLSELNLNKVDFIKMDIEGAEIEALKGMEQTLTEDVNLTIETHILDGKTTYKTVTQKLVEKGFRVRRKFITTLFASKIHSRG